jgi:polyisoprenoid-binding protein YceI
VLQLLLSTVAVAGALTAAPVPADTATFNIDKGHSEITFRIGTS